MKIRTARKILLLLGLYAIDNVVKAEEQELVSEIKIHFGEGKGYYHSNGTIIRGPNVTLSHTWTQDQLTNGDDTMVYTLAMMKHRDKNNSQAISRKFDCTATGKKVAKDIAEYFVVDYSIEEDNAYKGKKSHGEVASFKCETRAPKCKLMVLWECWSWGYD